MATKKQDPPEEEGEGEGAIVKTVVHLPWSQIWIGAAVAATALGLYITLPQILAFMAARGQAYAETQQPGAIQLQPDEEQGYAG